MSQEILVTHLARSSRAAEVGTIQRPKARKPERSAGTPRPSGRAPMTSGLGELPSHRMARWLRSAAKASKRCEEASSSAMRPRNCSFCLAVRARSRISQTASMSAEPMAPMNIAS